MKFSSVVLGIDFGGTKIVTAVSDLAGRQLAWRTLAAAADAPAAFARGVDSARELLSTAAAGWELAAVGVSMFGISTEHGVELAPSIDGWRDIAMGREVRVAFGGTGPRMIMANDVKAAALVGARPGALAGADPGIYLNLGTGLAAPIVTGGRVLVGANGAAGEVGYNLRAVSDVGAADRVPLEDAVSALPLARKAGGEGPRQRYPRRVHRRTRLPSGEPRHLHQPGPDRGRRHDPVLGPDPPRPGRGAESRGPVPAGTCPPGLPVRRAAPRCADARHGRGPAGPGGLPPGGLRHRRVTLHQ